MLFVLISLIDESKYGKVEFLFDFASVNNLLRDRSLFMPRVGTEEKWKRATFFLFTQPWESHKKLTQPHQEFGKKIWNLHKQSQFIS